MKVRQLSVFLENTSGRLAEITGALGAAGVNIRAFSLADTSDFGILRLVVNDIQRAHTALQAQGFTVRETEVIAIEIQDRPGGLAAILKVLGDHGVNVEYMYASLEKSSDNAVVILRPEDLDQAIATLLDHAVRLLPAERVYAL
ncbi:MAG TPA: ACT domain-containing protein [Candidatus Methylomirabilis sp.]|nr:ACT domain-containing protein [Candidatus Methylomirabilis sp.]